MRRRYIILLSLIAATAFVIIAFLHHARRYAQSLDCGSQMIAIGFAARVWAEDNNGLFPNDFLSMSNELNNTMVLICPSDSSRHRAENFSSMTPDNCSYEIVTKGLHEGDSNGVFVRCKIHGFMCYANGAVYDNNGQRMKKN